MDNEINLRANEPSQSVQISKIEEATDFLSALCSGYRSNRLDIPVRQALWTLQDRHSYWFDPRGDLNKVARKAVDLGILKDVFITAGARPPGLSEIQVGDQHSVIALPGFWGDFDVYSDIHPYSYLPRRESEVLEFLEGLSLRPNIEVLSGHGVQAMWLWREPRFILTPEDLDKTKQLLQRFHNSIVLLTEKYGWRFDNVANPARLIRVPGCLNHKKGNRDEN